MILAKQYIFWYPNFKMYPPSFHSRKKLKSLEFREVLEDSFKTYLLYRGILKDSVQDNVSYINISEGKVVI